MKGVGSYPDWPYYASPNSNLSAFAAPFSVNPYTATDVSSHLMGPAESAETVPPIHFPSYGYDFFSNPVRELGSSAQFPHVGLASYAPRSSFVDAQPYHAPYDHASSVTPYHWPPGTSSLDWPSLADASKSPELGFSGESAVPWDPFPEFNVKQVGLGSSLTPMNTNAAGLTVEERMNQNQGNQDVKDSASDEVPHKIDWEKNIVPASGGYLPDTSGWWRAMKPMSVECLGLGASAFPFPSMSLETLQEAPLKVVADSEKNHLSNNDSYDRHSRGDDKSSRVDTVPSMPRTELVTNLNIDNIIEDEHVGHNDFYNTKDAYHIPNSGTSGCFDSSYLHLHLGRTESSSSSKAVISDNNVSRNVVDFLFRGGHEFQNPCANVDSSSLSFSAIAAPNFVVKSFEDGDRCNPAEDSPCWKGSSAGHFSQFEPSVALPQECVCNKEESFDSSIRPQNYLLDTENNMKKLHENSNGYLPSSACSPRKFSLTKFSSEDCKAGGAVNGAFQPEPRCDHRLQFQDIIKMKENNVSPAKPTDSESRSSYTEHQVVDESSHKEHQVVEENKLMCLKQHTASHDAMSSPSSVVDTTIAPENSAGKVSTEKLNVQMLVDTMKNLSELLLYHCLNNTCELKERDCSLLENVVNNLKTCALKNAEQIEQIAPAQACLFNQSETSKCSGDSCEFQQNASCSKRPQLTKIGPETSKSEFENPIVAEAKLHFRSGKPLGKLSDSISPRDDTEMTKVDNMTKDLKRILSENFHHDDEGAEPHTVLYKNLWLEAEAALCSVYYKARYNQIKIEMDKLSYKEKEMGKQSKPEVVPTLSQSQSSANKVYNCPNTDSPALKLPVLESTNPEELSCLIFSTNMNKPKMRPCEGKGGQDPDSFIHNYNVSCSDKEAERNDKASVMARYQVLKARVDHSCIDTTTNVEEPLERADKSEPKGRDNQIQVSSCQDLPVPEKNGTDYEASVGARFHILKSRVEGSSSISSEGTLFDGVGFAGKEMDDTTIAKNVSEGKSLDVHVNPAVVNLNSYTSMDKSISNEFHLCLEENQEIQPSCELSTYSSDGFASDWEHVEKSS